VSPRRPPRQPRAPWELTGEWDYDDTGDVFWFGARRADAPGELLIVHPHYAVHEGVLHMFEFKAYREGTEPLEVTAEDIRSVPFSQLHTFARQLLADGKPSDMPTWPPTTHTMPPPDWLEDFSARRRPGRGGRDDYSYAATAARYVAFSKASKTPVKDLAAEVHLSPSQVRSLLHEARKRELLTKGASHGRGHAYGELTEKAIAILEKGRI
jgi:hypothetical protein